MKGASGLPGGVKNSFGTLRAGARNPWLSTIAAPPQKISSRLTSPRTKRRS